MTKSRFCAALALAAALVFNVASLRAEEQIVKHAETPAPTAGPTKAAAEGFCGDPTGTADELAKRYTDAGTLKQVDKSDQYITLADDPKNATVMYNFSTDKNPAHPVAVCRKLVKDGEEMTLKYNVVCGGSVEACAKAANDFNVLIARMQAAINEKIAGEKK